MDEALTIVESPNKQTLWKSPRSLMWLPVIAVSGKIAATYWIWQDILYEQQKAGIVGSPLPLVILLTGILFAILLGFAVYFAQKASRRNDELKQLNRSLQEEVMKREETEKNLKLLTKTLEVRALDRTRELSVQKATVLQNMREVIQARRAAEQSEEKILRQANELAISNAELRKQMDERKHLEAQLIQSQKMEAVGRLAGGIAHDFNNILMVIQGYCDFLRLEMDPKDIKHKKVEEIQKNTDRAAGLIRQLLAFSRRQMIRPKVIQLNELVHDLEQMLRRLIGEDVELVTNLDPEVGRAKVDPGQLEQVLVNLAVNARDAMPRGGHLTISTNNILFGNPSDHGDGKKMPMGEYIMLAVSDTGSGISKDSQKHIFEPFFTTKSKEKGTGLGLATSYGIIKQNNGHIWVYSEPNHGTTFKIYLPRVYEKRSKPEESPKRSQSMKGSETVLLVEDDHAVRELVVETLREHGYRIIEAENGEQALELIEKDPDRKIDLLLTDIVMPKMGGRDLADRFRSLYSDTKVLYTSGYTDDMIVRHGVLEDKIAFLQKPYNQQLLLSKVRHVLDEVA